MTDDGADRTVNWGERLRAVAAVAAGLLGLGGYALYDRGSTALGQPLLAAGLAIATPLLVWMAERARRDRDLADLVSFGAMAVGAGAGALHAGRAPTLDPSSTLGMVALAVGVGGMVLLAIANF